MFSLFSLTAFFHATNFLYHDCFFAAFLSGNSLLRYCTASATDSRELFFTHWWFLPYTSFTFATVPRVLRIWESFFCPEAFFTLNSSFPTFDTTCFYQGFPENRMFFPEDCRVSQSTEKYRPDPSFCLNHTVFSKRYYSVGSIYVLRPYRALYQLLPGFELTI